jgi:hypothetical protein
MGVPTSEVGYTSATTGRGDHEVHDGHVVALDLKNMLDTCLFPTRNGTRVPFIPAYIDHCSTSGQSNTVSRYVVCYLLYVFLEILSTRIS